MLDRSEKLREELEKKKAEEEKKEDCCISNFPNRKMYTPLHIAASRGSLKSMKVLLDFGIDVNILDNKDNTALHEACRTGHSASAELLIKSNVNIKMKNHIGATALHFACMKGMSKIAVLLIKNGANGVRVYVVVRAHLFSFNDSEYSLVSLHNSLPVSLTPLDRTQVRRFRRSRSITRTRS